jgi:tRNA U54 and U55 pseudouridine synthase Pus10
MLQFNRGAMLKGLLTLLVSPPNIPPRHCTVCCRMLEDFSEFGSAGWTNLPEAQVNNTACDGGHNIHISGVKFPLSLMNHWKHNGGYVLC